MYSMTWEDAKKAMREGKAVKHEYFSPDEFFRMQGNQMVDESGQPVARWYSGELWQKTGWSILDDKMDKLFGLNLMAEGNSSILKEFKGG